jgi:hypothetical protein
MGASRLMKNLGTFIANRNVAQITRDLRNFTRIYEILREFAAISRKGETGRNENNF